MRARKAPHWVSAINYMLKRRETLSRFLDDGSLPLDNNRCERAIRPMVTGHSNWLFAGSLAAGVRAAQIMILLPSIRVSRNVTEQPCGLTVMMVLI